MIVRLAVLITLFGAQAVHASDTEVAQAHVLQNKTVVVIRDVSIKSKGPLLVYLYRTKETWLEAEKAVQKTVLKNTGKTEYRWSLKNLPAGEYAVQVIHDEDSNGTLTMGFFGPSEGVGVSQYVPSFIPSFDKAKFKHNGQSSLVSVEMNY